MIKRMNQEVEIESKRLLAMTGKQGWDLLKHTTPDRLNEFVRSVSESLRSVAGSTEPRVRNSIRASQQGSSSQTNRMLWVKRI